MRGGARKVTPKVVDGKVQKKNSQSTTFNYWDHDPGYPFIDKQRPGPGYRHVLTTSDIKSFIDILPDWKVLSVGLKAIVLAEAEDDTAGWHSEGVVGICAWERDLWHSVRNEFFSEHKVVYDRLGLEYEDAGDGMMMCKWTENQAKAYQLLHIFLHELGHHHDRMTSRKKKESGRGESYAEQYALAYMDQIWAEYIKRFPLY